MAILALIAIGIMAVILLVLFSVRWRLLPTWASSSSGSSGPSASGYLGIPLTDRHHRRAAGDARHRHRLLHQMHASREKES
jgi:hypothetical protein